ncbi:MAG: UbiD family decarboxylase [Chloroflexi bacterium]|nr:UbiD family decarboxylase [Chloroflexota bacterium]
MAYKDLREFMAVLEKRGELTRVKAEVDPSWEINGITKRLIDEAVTTGKGPAVLFENIKNHKVPVLSNVIVTPHRLGLVMGLDTEDERQVRDEWVKRIAHPIPPKIVKTGPCKENILTGDKADLNAVCPPVQWHKGDGGPYLGTLAMQVTRDPETGVQNAGIYRQLYFSKNETSLYMGHFQHGMIHLKKWARMYPGKPMPVAAVIGTEPAYLMAAAAKFTHPPAEEDYAGGLRGEPEELVKCETCDLHVPAHAEIVLEGEVYPDELRLDGPFGEYPGYLGAAQMFNVFHVKAITHRNNPIFQGEREGYPSEGQFMTGKPMEYLLYSRFKGYSGVVDMHMPYSGTLYILYVSMRKFWKGQVNQLINAILGDIECGTIIKLVVVVDDNVNVRDINHVNWAIANHVQPDRDIVIIPRGPEWELDAAQPYSKRGWSAHMGIDATLPVEEYEAEGTQAPPLCDDPDIRAKVVAQWQKYGIKI